jgi:hypothetical protein
LWCAAFVAAVASAARADGVLLGPGALSPPARAELAASISLARRARPDLFERARALRGHKPEVYGKSRAQRPSVATELRALGPEGLFAIVDLVAFSALPRDGATQGEWTAVRTGLLEALGELRSAQGALVLRAVFESSGMGEPELVSAARGLGRMGGAGERAVLVAALERDEPRRRAALAGLRFARRPEVVEAIGARIAREPEERVVREAATALGYLGSSWAWATGRAGAPGDEQTVRRRCAEVLLGVYLAHRGETRREAARALWMVDYPDTYSRASRAMASATAEERAALESLLMRLRR